MAAAARWVAARKFTNNLVITTGYGSELLKFVEEILDGLSFLIQVLVIKTLVRATAFRLNDHGFADPGLRFKYPLVGVMSFVRQDGFCPDIRMKCMDLVQITGPATGQTEPRYLAQGTDSGVDLGAYRVFVSYDCLVLVF